MEVRITKLRVAMAALFFVLAGVGLGSLLSPLVGTALATVGTVSNISDHSASAYFAKVSSDGKLAVGDGAGPLSVDGTVTDRPAAPASPWRASTSFDTSNWIAGPSASPINVTSLSISTDAPLGAGNGIPLALFAYHVASNATSCAQSPILDGTIWEIRDLSEAVPLVFTFPTPLQWKPPANSKACLLASTGPRAFTTTVNAVGFYGG
jgi:hypothetical protein